MSSAKVAYIYDENLRKQCDKTPKMRYRATLVQDLINCTQLLTCDSVKIYRSKPATEEELKSFHSSDYIDYVKSINDTTDFDKEHLREQEVYGLSYDCPVLSNLHDFMSTIAGGSLTAAQVLLQTDIRVAINWFGGMHHAQRNEAEGFCYVNDIVIAIEKLKAKFSSILYVDLDVHHGDGVQNAFELSNKVLTLSFHQVSPGFFPGTGLQDEIGIGNGKNYCINVPYKEGIGDEMFEKLFTNIFPCVFESYKPKAMVIQCGGDIISGDPVGVCNVTLKTMGRCVKMILNCDIPTIFLGGGGYNFPNTARYWTYLTSVIVGKNLDEDIPDDSLFFTEYGPTYELQIYPSNMRDGNAEEYIETLITSTRRHCDNIRV